MSKSHTHAWILLLAALLTGSTSICAAAQEDEAAGEQIAEPEPIPLEHHRWARFPIGAWRKTRIVEQTLGDGQQVTGRSEIVRTEWLKDVGRLQFTLGQEVDIEVDGERVQSPSITVSLGLATDEPGTVQSFSEAPAEVIAVDGRDIETRVLTVETGGEVYTVHTRLWYSPDEPPYVLRQLSEAVVPASQETVWRRTKRLLARELPHQWQDKQVPSTFWEEQHVTTKGTRHSIIVTVDSIPGGVVARWTKETNLEGQVIRRETETLLSWDAEADPGSD